MSGHTPERHQTARDDSAIEEIGEAWMPGEYRLEGKCTARLVPGFLDQVPGCRLGRELVTFHAGFVPEINQCADRVAGDFRRNWRILLRVRQVIARDAARALLDSRFQKPLASALQSDQAG